MPSGVAIRSGFNWFIGSLPIGSMVLLYMVTWIPSIYPLDVSIYTSTMDPMGLVHDSKESAGVVSLFPYPMEVCYRLGLMCCNIKKGEK